MYIFKWEWWTIRNEIKYNGINLGYHAIRITWRRNFHNNLDFLLKKTILNNIEKDKLTIITNKINGPIFQHLNVYRSTQHDILRVHSIGVFEI